MGRLRRAKNEIEGGGVTPLSLLDAIVVVVEPDDNYKGPERLDSADERTQI